MLTITIAGNQYPVHFGMRGLTELCEKLGVSFDQLITTKDAVKSIKSMVALGVLGLNEGARKAGAKNAKIFTEDDVWDAIDEDPGILLQVADAFSIATKPLVERINRVLDPNS